MPQIAPALDESAFPTAAINAERSLRQRPESSPIAARLGFLPESRNSRLQSVVKAADEFMDKTMAPNQLWQTDFTYLEVIGWGWFYLRTILDDFSHYIISW